MVEQVEGPRILMSAYQCGPGMGSVSQIGWEWYSHVAARLPVTLITHIRNRPALEDKGAPLPGTEVVYIDTEWFAAPLYRFAKWLFPRSEHSVIMLSSLDFYLYDRVALRSLRKRLRQADTAPWDLIHSPTPVSPSAASLLHRLGLPTVFGPLNGGLRSPSGFPEFMRADSSWLYPVRNFGRVFDWLRGSTGHAARILVATRSTREWYPERVRARCVDMLENAVDLARFPPQEWPAPPGDDTPLRLVFVGRLVPFKALPLLLRAMSRLRERLDIRLTVVGDGPMRADWEAESAQLGLNDRVDFVGARPLDEVSRFMAQAHCFCLPSVRESGGAVLLEAMASQRPVIAVDFGGPAEIVDDAVGRKLRAIDNETVIGGFEEALADLVAHPEDWRRRGQAGRARVAAKFTWDAKVDAAVGLFKALVGERTGGSVNA